MLVIDCKQTTFFDIDETLVRWRLTQKDWDIGAVIRIPYIDSDGQEQYDRIARHEPHIRRLIEHKARGHTIICWSAGGSEWAEKAIKLLKLEPWVDLVIAKPTWAYDDLKPGEFFSTIYLDPYLNEGEE